MHRKVLIGATNVETGVETVFDFDDFPTNKEKVETVVSSASVPLFFPYTEVRGQKMMDSLSTGWNVNMVSAVEKCMTMVDDPGDIVLDIIVMYPDRLHLDNNNGTTLIYYDKIREMK